MKKPIEKIELKGMQASALEWHLIGRVNQIIDYLFPEEGGEMELTPCCNAIPRQIDGKLWCSACGRDFSPELTDKWKEVYQDGYDAGAAEATQVCNNKAIPQAHKEGREEMKAELREKISMDFVQMYLGGNIQKEHWYKGYTKCAQDIIEKLLS